MTLKLTKLEKEKQELDEALKKNISVKDVVSGYFEKGIRKHYPTIDSFAKYLLTFKPKMAESKKQKVLEHYELVMEKYKYSNSNGNVHSVNTKAFLGITDTEYKKFKEEGFLIPAEYVEFRKWGKNLKTPYYNYDILLDIKKNHLVNYRLKLAGFKSRVAKADWTTFMIHIKKEFSVVYVNNKWLYPTMLYKNQSQPIYEKLNIDINNKNFDKVEHYNKKNNDLFVTEIKKANKRISQSVKDIEKMLIQYNITDDEINVLNQFLYHKMMGRDTFMRSMDSVINEILKDRTLLYTKNILDLANYHKSFPIARAITRDIQFIVGPTNSGKTYESLSSLMAAKSGIYLAPLRLMALEVFDKLNNAGIPCNLITGEDQIMMPNAQHTSSTIECLNVNHLIDVAIIDEFQMVADQQRGWAWSQAILGVPANKVFIIGNKTALNHSIKVLKLTNDTINITNKERLSELVVLENPLEIKDLRHGDALICFSRKNVLSYASTLKSKGKKVSVIYGALPPEVRKKQAELFSSGATDILVSTDAIGMGLNLPIDRVIFSQITKYDGEENRMLLNTEIKQIAGRAGRFTNTGFVGVLGKENKESIKHIKTGLNSSDVSIDKFQISPNEWHVKIIQENLDLHTLVDIIQVFPSLCKSENFYGIKTYELIEVAYMADRELNMKLTEKLKFAFTPIDLRSGPQIDQFKEILRKIFKDNINKEMFLYKNYYKHLELDKAEIETKLISIYNYLAKYSDYMDVNSSKNRKDELDRLILKEITDIDFYFEYESYRENYYY